MKPYIKILVLCALVNLLATGCINFKAQSVVFDPETKELITNSVRVIAILNTSKLDKIDIATKTKTTSKLVSAKNAFNTGDAATIEAISNLINTIQGKK